MQITFYSRSIKSFGRKKFTKLFDEYRFIRHTRLLANTPCVGLAPSKIKRSQRTARNSVRSLARSLARSSETQTNFLAVSLTCATRCGRNGFHFECGERGRECIYCTHAQILTRYVDEIISAIIRLFEHFREIANVLD